MSHLRCRYTLFYVLYPLGVGSEIGLIIVSLAWVRETDVFSFHMPNKWNFAFDYYTVLILAILSYLPGAPPSIPLPFPSLGFSCEEER
jgi:very-long-chain (3R)-3-hydroxyacyl-CoA dehydratase